MVETDSRGLIAASTATGTAGWVQARATEAGVQVTGPQARAWQAVAAEAKAPDMAVYAHAVTTGAVGVTGGAILARELRSIRRHVPAATWDACAGEVVGYAVAGATARELAALRDVIITQYGDDEDGDWLGRRERDAHERREFTSFRVDPDGRHTARVSLDPASAAVVQAAIEALSAPNRNRHADHAGPSDQADHADQGDQGDHAARADRGEAPRDERTAGQRRADALVDLCTVVATDPSVLTRERPGAASRAQVVITMRYQDLRDDLHDHNHRDDQRDDQRDEHARRGRGYGLTAFGQPLSPQTVRRFACDASIIPAVLGSQNEPVNLGRATRTATPGQITHLRLRDKGCTFPGCDRPPSFCQAHHVRYWTRDTGPATSTT